MKAGAAVLRADKEPIVFPLLSSIALLIVTASFGLTMALSGVLDRLEEGPTQALGLVVTFLFYVVRYTAIIFSNSACAVGGWSAGPFAADGAVRLTTPPAGAGDQNPAFSPDGSQLVFTCLANGYNAGPAGLFPLTLPVGAPARLTPAGDRLPVYR